MNTLQGTIASILTEGNLSLVKLHPENKPDDWVTSLVIETPATAAYLREDEKVNILFKETEVMIAKDSLGQISIQNRFRSTIKAIEKGKLLGKVILDYAGVEIISMITVNAVNTLQLQEGDVVLALVKTNEISIAPND